MDNLRGFADGHGVLIFDGDRQQMFPMIAELGA